MSETQSQQSDSFKKANRLFYEKAKKALHHLFDLAKAKNELHFAFSLAAEFRGLQDPGWNTAMEAHVAFEEYMEFMKKNPDTGFNVRIALAFCCHLAEASGFYEIPKNILRVAEGQRYKAWPFEEIVEKQKRTGDSIAPNANKVIRNLVGHATTLGLNDMAEVFRDAFDSDVRNGFSHADYVIWNDGIRLPKRNGGTKRIVSWPEFNALLERGINFFNLLSGKPQLFARPRTPNDNPFIESAFSTVKRAPEYPGRFLDDDQAIAYFKGYFTWYDTEHYHSGIDYVTPQQAHQGQRQTIVDQRRTKKLAQRRRRREENQMQKTGTRKINNHITRPASLVA